MSNRELSINEYRKLIIENQKSNDVIDKTGNTNFKKYTIVDINYIEFKSKLCAIQDALDVKIIFDDYRNAPSFEIFYLDTKIGMIYLASKLSFSFDGSCWRDDVDDEAKLKIINLCIEYTK